MFRQLPANIRNDSDFDRVVHSDIRVGRAAADGFGRAPPCVTCFDVRHLFRTASPQDLGPKNLHQTGSGKNPDRTRFELTFLGWFELLVINPDGWRSETSGAQRGGA